MVKINPFSNSDSFYQNNKVTQQSEVGNNTPLLSFGQKSTELVDFSTTPPPKDNPTNNVDTKWVKTYANYAPKNKEKYNKVYKFVEDYAKKMGNTTANIKEITNMICNLSDNYGMDPELIAPILAHETGGFVFTAKVMSGRDKYKGVGQVDRDVVDCLYAPPYNWKTKYPTKRDEALSYDTMHWQQDKKRIEQLKKKYLTAEALWKAIQKDVSLGLEVSIIAYKMKLHAAKGNTRVALSNYCSGQYQLPADSTATKKYAIPLPSYKVT